MGEDFFVEFSQLRIREKDNSVCGRDEYMAFPKFNVCNPRGRTQLHRGHLYFHAISNDDVESQQKRYIQINYVHEEWE
jgi:hypothetical protein